MRHFADISTQDPSGMKDVFICPECYRKTMHSILSIINSRHFEEQGMVQLLDNYLTIYCDGCGTVSFCHVSRCTAEEDYTQDGSPYLPKQKKQYPTVQPDLGDEGKPFISITRVSEIEALPKDQFDTTKLAQLLIELNRAYQAHSYFSCLMLIRTILNHVPPLFGKSSFQEVVNHYPDRGTSFRKSMKHLEESCRKFADGSLHLGISKSESIPTSNQVEFRADLDALIAEIIRRYKNPT